MTIQFGFRAFGEDEWAVYGDFEGVEKIGIHTLHSMVRIRYMEATIKLLERQTAAMERIATSLEQPVTIKEDYLDRDE